MATPDEWELDAEPDLAPLTPEGRGEGSERATLPDDESRASPQPTPAPPHPRSLSARGEGGDLPPPPLRIVEAMLFVGGPPLTAAKACSAVRGLSADRFHDLIDELARKYRRQNRPYSVQPRDDGFVLAVKPQFKSLREKLYGGPRQARLSQPAVDVLSLVAYRQPLSKPEIDALRGTDSAAVVRQLVRLGLIAVTRRADSEQRAVQYGTTPRFLGVFGLGSLDDLPRLET